MMEFNIKDVEAEIKQANDMFEKAVKSAKDKVIAPAKFQETIKLLEKIQHEIVRVFEVPDYEKTEHMREFLYNFEKAYEHKGTPGGTASLKKAIRYAHLALEDMKEEKKRRDVMTEVIKKRKQKGLQ